MLMSEIKFAMNLDSLDSDVLSTLSAGDIILSQPTKIVSGTSSTGDEISSQPTEIVSNEDSSQNISAINNNTLLPSDITLKANTNFIKDSKEELTLLRFTTFQSFPVKYVENGEEVVTMVPDGGGNREVQLGINPIGHHCFPSSFDRTILRIYNKKIF